MRIFRIVAGIACGLLGLLFAVIAGTAVGVFATRTYRFQSSPVIAFSVFGILAVVSFIAARKLIWFRKIPA
jgi:hypothetical protein